MKTRLLRNPEVVASLYKPAERQHACRPSAPHNSMTWHWDRCSVAPVPDAEAGSFQQLPRPLLGEQLAEGAQVANAQLHIRWLQQICQHILPAQVGLRVPHSWRHSTGVVCAQRSCRGLWQVHDCSAHAKAQLHIRWLQQICQHIPPAQVGLRVPYSWRHSTGMVCAQCSCHRRWQVHDCSAHARVHAGVYGARQDHLYWWKEASS